MEFQNCRECDKYRYIKTDKLCPSCFEEWVVLFRVPHMACYPEVMDEGLSKQQAEEKAEDSPKLVAKPSTYI